MISASSSKVRFELVGKCIAGMALAAALLVVPGCAASDEDVEGGDGALTAQKADAGDAPPARDSGADAKADAAADGASDAGSGLQPNHTTSFRGSFHVATDDGDVSFDFKVSRINWNVGSAQWDATVTQGVTAGNDVAVPMGVRIGECEGCFEIYKRAPSGSSVEPIVLTVTNGELSQLVYFGATADALTLK